MFTNLGGGGSRGGFNFLAWVYLLITVFGPATSGMQFIDQFDIHHPLLGQFAYDTDVSAGGTSGVAEFDLSAFAGQTIDIRFQFGSDGSIEAAGFGMDNLAIVAVPEPATMALIGTALVAGGGLVYVRRNRRKALRFARQ